MENPCDAEDLNIFYASTTITVGNGARTPFWDSPWLLGRSPKDIAPLIFKASKRKSWKVREALKHNAWILKIKTPTNVTAEHITQFFILWMPCMRSNSMNSPRTTSYGSIRLEGPTRRHSHTRRNSWGWFSHPWIKWLEGLGSSKSQVPCLVGTTR